MSKNNKQIKVKKPKRRVPVKINQKAGPMCSKKEYNRMKDKKWEDEHADELFEIDRLMKEGHTITCARYMVWFGGSCVCEYEKKKEK